jgi:outer membrane protein TolC/membrane protein DedA with SNARE-associated domain
MTHAIQYILTHGAPVLFAWILIQQAGAPLPSAALLLSVGTLASSGRVNIASVLAASFGACLAADGFWYHVGRTRSGLVANYVSPRANTWTARVLGLMSRHAAGALLPAKFLSCSNLAALMAGRADMVLGRFLAFDSAASLLWAGGYIALGYLIGNHFKAAVQYASVPLLVLLEALAVWSLAKLMSREWRLRLHVAMVSILMLLCVGASTAVGQYSASMGSASGYATAQGSAEGQGSGITGSVPSGVATADVLHLTLRDAISQALRYNLATIENGENARIARGQRMLALSKLLPQVSAGASENVQQLSLAMFGLKIPGIPTLLGPFSYSSADASVSQTLFSFESIQRFRSARTAEEAAKLNYQDVMDLVTLAVGNAYLQVIEANSRIDAQEAQVRNARALYEQARDEVESGTAPRIDLTRTEVQLHTEEYNLSVTRNNFAVAKLNLGRGIGLPLGQQFDLADQLPYSDINPPTLEDALKLAYNARSDFRAALDAEKSAVQTRSAVKGERYPVIAANGDYGDIGPTFGQSHGDFTFQGGVNIPIFTGGRIKGDITQAEGALRQRKAEAENLRGQIDYDVRTAFLNLNAAKEQVNVARQNVDLANENLARSKDRFTSGVTDSVEVVQAQQALASANDQYITSLYNHGFAKLSLARAVGVARTNYDQFLGGK